jgi:bifunctional DNA-binding transcriptional regulator/antitoxin component of YhaV-PrlF toxin-antitoxin module
MGMTEITTDERGRITIPKGMRDRFGERYRLVELRDGIKLLPRPEDPLEALRSAGSDELREASMDEIRDVAVEEGHKQAGTNVR